MLEHGSLLGFLSDPRLAPHALGDAPVWLWSADATRILWGNPAAAAVFNAPSSTALSGHTIDPKGSAALQIARLAGTLAPSAAPRLERLRGFGGGVGGALMCGCSRISLSDGMPAILVVGTEAVGRLSLADKAKRLLTDCDKPLVLFSADGALLSATESARGRLGGVENLAVLGAAALGATALATGRAEGTHHSGKLSVTRIGADPSSVLLVAFADAAPTDTSEVKPQSPAPDAVVPPAHPEQAAASPVSQEPSAAPVQPLRFVWQTDSNGRFMLESNEFKTLIGPKATAALGQPWSVIAATLRLDPEGQVARALASRETWSRITVAFPAEGTDARLAVELSGLPVFDRDRSFRGYRGFGVCRHAARIAALTRKEPAGPPAPRPQADAPVNIVQFPPSAPADGVPTLTSGERRAFSELASRLSARLHGADKARPERPNDAAAAPPSAEKPADAPPRAVKAPAAERPARAKPEAATRTSADPRPILDRLPIGVLVYRLDRLIYANRAFLEWTGYEQLHALEEAGGLDALFVEPNDEEPVEGNGGQSLTIATNQGDQVPVAARLFTAPWDGESALVLMLSGVGGDEPQQAFGTAPHEPEAETGNLRAILDAAADGVVVIDRDNRVQSISTGGARLFGYARREAAGLLFTNLFMPESQRRVLHALDRSGTAQAGGRGNGCDVIGRHREGVPVPLFMMLSPIEGDGDRLCAVFRDMTAWKKAESELHYARRQTEQALAAKSDFLAKISHEIRTPLNAIIGFSEVMMQERFGAIGNERYRQYLKDIHTSGGHLIALLNDLLDLSKIEAGKLDLDFSDVDLNELTQQSVALMQPQATRERIIIRTSLGSALPTVSADARSVRQILLNLISNSIKFTGAGGQVIVSTARGEDGEVVLRVRDTGVGMNEQDLVAALEPFRRVATSAREGSGGIGLGLPLTKALAEANRARFKIKSAVDAGTLVEVAFPGGRLAAE